MFGEVRPIERAVVFGKPDFEENSLAVTAELARSYEGQVILLCNNVERALRYLGVVQAVETFPIERVTLIKRTP